MQRKNPINFHPRFQNCQLHLWFIISFTNHFCIYNKTRDRDLFTFLFTRFIVIVDVCAWPVCLFLPSCGRMIIFFKKKKPLSSYVHRCRCFTPFITTAGLVVRRKAVARGTVITGGISARAPFVFSDCRAISDNRNIGLRK